QQDYNKKFRVTPKTIQKPIAPLIELPLKKSDKKSKSPSELIKKLSPAQKKNLVKSLTAEMREASRNLEFERAAELRDLILKLEEHI
ncbi:MAG: UvrB/UvrC motif-containing protein, partial [Selenomonadaceae bacterium]|nr:UvrB/UvrC motif-containing protein [Selenomonadaceae bacterium]